MFKKVLVPIKDLKNFKLLKIENVDLQLFLI